MNRFDVAVIGGGILGCLIAREITASDPSARVAVFERDGLGAGASRYSAGLHFPRGGTSRVRDMSAYSEDYYARLRLGEPGVPVYPLPMAVVAPATAEAGVRARYLPRADLSQVDTTGHPAVRVAGSWRVWAGEGCHYADVYGLVQWLARDLRPRVTCQEGVAVTSVGVEADSVVLGLSTGEETCASRAVLAPGPWVASPAWHDLTRPLGLRVKKVAAIHIEEPPGEGAPCVVFEQEDAFLLPLAHRGHWLFSYTCPQWDTDPDAAPAGLAAEQLAQAREVLHGYAPGLAARCTSGRVFCDAYSPDRQPVVQALDSAGRVVFAGAANGSGYRLGPAIAAEVTRLLAEPAAPPVMAASSSSPRSI